MFCFALLQLCLSFPLHFMPSALTLVMDWYSLAVQAGFCRRKKKTRSKRERIFHLEPFHVYGHEVGTLIQNSLRSSSQSRYNEAVEAKSKSRSCIRAGDVADNLSMIGPANTQLIMQGSNFR
jgi:hypothetical protein